MIGAFAHLLRWDAALQVRSHFATATAIVAAMFCAAALLYPEKPAPLKLATLLIFMDPAVVGVTFVGAQILMERTAGALSAVMTTPLRPAPYIAAKVVSLTTLGAAAGATIALVAAPARIDPLHLSFGLFLTNAFGVLLGLALVARAASVNALLRNIAIVSVALALPLVAYFNLAPAPLARAMAVVPTGAMLNLIEAGLSEGGAPLSALYLAAWCAALWRIAVADYASGRLARGSAAS